MKDVLVVCQHPPWFLGGVEKVIGEVGMRLKSRFNIRIYCTDVDSSNVGERVWEGIPVTLFKSFARQTCWSPSLLQALRKEKLANLIHAHNYGALIPFNVAMAARGIPVIVSPHFHSADRLVRRVFDHSVGPYSFRNAEFLVFNSIAENADLYEAFNKLRKIESQVIYNGCSLGKIRRAQPFEREGKVILSASRLIKYKNVHIVLQVLKHLTEYTALVTGSGPEEAALKELAKNLGIEGRVIFLGYVSEEELYRWYRTATVFVQLSAIESFGLTCVEALAAGTPVVANEGSSGLRATIELLSPNILPVDVRRDSPNEIARVIRQAAGMRVDADLSIFDWDYIGNQFGELYSKLAR